MSNGFNGSNLRKLVPTVVLAITAFGAFGAMHQAAAAPVGPDMDFRQLSTFGNLNPNHETSIGFDFTTPGGDTVGVTASAKSNGRDAELWQDGVDGLGIRGMEEDEIDANETLTLVFDSPIIVSHLFFSDLFANEGRNGDTYDESGQFRINTNDWVQFDAASLAEWGDPGNGEAAYAFDSNVSVKTLAFTATGPVGQSDYSVIGLLDPEEVPEPGALALFGAGLIGLGVARRRRG